MHETNTFQSTPTTYADFAEAGDRPPLARGAQVLTAFEGMNTSVAGAITVLREAGATLTPLPWTSATPSGFVTRDAYERIAAMILEDLRAALPLDALYLSLHGAMVAEHVEDAEGELLARIRALVGPELPIAVSLDLHSNTTPQMFALSDAMVAYCTYPHVDMAETGAKAARLLAQILDRGAKPSKAYRQSPYLIPLTWQCSTLEPSKGIHSAAEAMIDGAVASTSFTPGFPAADIRDCGPAVFAYGWERAAVEDAVERLDRMVLEAESRYAGRLWSPDDAVREAMRRTQSSSRPVLLADTQDNPGAGGSADTVGLLTAMVRNQAQRTAFGVFHDPAAALAAHNAGVGVRITVGIGAKGRAFGERPLVETWHVERIGDGNMTCDGPMMNGWRLALGPMAWLRTGGVSVVVSTKKIQPMDQEPFRHVGIEPRRQRAVGLKSSVHFRAAFEPMAEDVLVVESPGAMIVDPAKLPFARLRAGVRLHPLGPTFPLA
jgi:microcystin degradation protein MlrC